MWIGLVAGAAPIHFHTSKAVTGNARITFRTSQLPDFAGTAHVHRTGHGAASGASAPRSGADRSRPRRSSGGGVRRSGVDERA